MLLPYLQTLIQSSSDQCCIAPLCYARAWRLCLLGAAPPTLANDVCMLVYIYLYPILDIELLYCRQKMIPKFW
jgi:hypothetical protein